MPAAVVATLPSWALPAAIVAGLLLCGIGGFALWSSRQERRRRRQLNGSTRALAAETVQRQRAQEALAESETRYRLIFENLMDIVCLLDEQLCFVDVSPSVQALLGYTPEELIGRSVQELMPNGALERARQDAAMLFSEARPEPQTYPLVAKDGTLRHIEIVAAPMGRGEGSRGIVLVARDISPRLEAEERLHQTRAQLVQAHKMESIALLAGGVAHDFNNMLTAILGNIELAMMEVEEGTQLHGDLTEARRSAERAADLTRQLLLFSHQQALEMGSTDLSQVAQDLLKMLGRLIGEDIRIVAELCPEPPRILGDAGQLQQVLMNLCLNARDAMPEGGILTIQVDQVVLGEDDAARMLHARPGRYARLSVTDTGIGMTDDVQERIFEPFFTTKAAGRGTGLGLSVSYAVVRDHGGWINVYSEPEQGTTFRVYLPACDEDAEASGLRQGTEPEAAATSSGQGERILLVEDEDDVRRFAGAALEGAGYTVFEAANVADALRLVEQHDGYFDLVFCDMILPDRTGIELVGELRARYPDLHVLLASGYADQRAHWGTVREEGYPYMQKPYGLTQLLAAVRETLHTEEPPEPV
jgi:two-component system, cell cycle sensor histidine kinase and response regulator CckA